jgi:hypothetical protein
MTPYEMIRQIIREPMKEEKNSREIFLTKLKESKDKQIEELKQEVEMLTILNTNVQSEIQKIKKEQ